MRKCHLNNCPVGVATQDPTLRKRYRGKPEYVERFCYLMAEEVREYMAQLGFRKLDDLIGRSDLLEMNEAIGFWKARGLDFSRIFHRVPAGPDEGRRTISQKHGLEGALDFQLMPLVEASLKDGRKVLIESRVRNVNRTVGTIISSRIARQYGNAGLPDGTITLSFKGAAGQSFGAFGAKGLTLILEGEANDYLGKGLSGARIVVKPYAGHTYAAASNIIAGNVLFYGATSGEAYLSGRVGERFAIRNSGAHLVVEGCGDHGCEYMTGGRVVIMGSTGVNFGAGMSGGIAYVLDDTGMFDSKCNLEMIDLEPITGVKEAAEVRGMIERHFALTGSRKAEEILGNWEFYLPQFVKVLPMEYRRVLGQMMKEDEATRRDEVIRE
jgi:glutamate synthase domain-containing protein 3